ncbi:MAG: hypothetical protein NZ932_02360 [Candidatus Bathyarchaeota archaeon]|nr:hypothetical protein [Candidatus Bathyarchaeota archaeon]MDW8039903.1 hypothetical protein [Nitrososphaerota archaeon]
MRRVLRKQKSVYMFSLFLCLAGATALLGAFWKTYPQLSASQNPFSTFLSLLWTENVNVVGLIKFKLIYLVVFGDITLILGFILWLLSRQWFVVPGKTVWYECSFCKKRWKAVGDKALVHCPHCRQLVHPKIVEDSNLK